MKYQLKKSGYKKWNVSQSEKDGHNVIGITFKSAKAALNHIKSKGENVLVFHNQVVDSELATKLDKPSFVDDIRTNYSEVKSVKFKDNKTTVLLTTGCDGVSSCHPEDEFSKYIGFFVAYHRARTKPLTKELIIKNVYNRILPIDALATVL